MGSIVVFIISLTLRFRFEKMNIFLVIIISVFVGELYSAEANRLMFVEIIFNFLISLCAIGLGKLLINIKPKLTKMSKSTAGFFSGDEDLTVEEKEELDAIPSENMFGLITLLLGGAGFLFGPQLLFVPIISLLIGILTFGTLDKSSGQNPWTFYLGITLSIIGIVLHKVGYVHMLS
ncbi:hypothetical protein IM538_13075 [Cytobacillus suaedae]|nr:hypothetical protein IM538_13075 [Cytobacillus suaedae]